MNKIPMQRLFRIQGGIFPNRSRKTIRIENNKIMCSNAKSIYVGNEEHMAYFLFRRLGITQVKDMPKNIEEFDIHILEMYVPYWINYLIEKYSIDEISNKNKELPRLVDKTTPRTIISIKEMVG